MCMKSNEHYEATIKTRAKAKECLKQKSFSTYSTKTEDIQYSGANTKARVMYSMSFTEKIRTTNDEVLMVSNIDLLSSLGGALGLFIGFSFFGYLATALDAFVDRRFLGCFKR